MGYIRGKLVIEERQRQRIKLNRNARRKEDAVSALRRGAGDQLVPPTGIGETALKGRAVLLRKILIEEQCIGVNSNRGIDRFWPEASHANAMIQIP
ncbi:MAG: hypothetical protein A3F74_01890 [Betaproteobacteria bacterium RIFCSPLOWO2_12_FULL_62_58]|nr:MAG: hypothetical protein A3F74_01890 [Betaproteobacteria bacterium RIFCSPLOWO2_12_FULL_62_58]